MLDKIKVEKLCKRWASVSRTSWNGLQSLEINENFERQYYCVYDTPEDITEFIVQVLERCGVYLNDIKVEYYNKSPLNYKQIMFNLQKFCSNLNSLLLKNNFRFEDENIFSDKAIQLIFKNNENLKNISLVDLNLNGKCFSCIRNPKIIES